MAHDFHILLVEDSPTDAKIIERAFRECRFSLRLTVLRDGQSALDFLQALVHADAPADDEPDLILLDLNLPGIDGFQVLEWSKAHEYLRAIPVVVLTTSTRDED